MGGGGGATRVSELSENVLGSECLAVEHCFRVSGLEFFSMVLLVLVILRLGLVLCFVWLLRKCVKGKRSCFFLPPLSQCLMLEQITLGEQKCSKLGEIRRVLGFSSGSTGKTILLELLTRSLPFL